MHGEALGEPVVYAARTALQIAGTNLDHFVVIA
jgi:hypothetical protein